MRIAEINDIASVASELAEGLRERGHAVDLFEPRLFGAGLAPRLKPMVAPARAYDWLDLIRKVRGGHYDLAHIHYGYMGNVGVLGRFPYILHCHGTDLRELTAFTRPLVASALKHARHVFYSTPDLRALVTAQRPDAEFLPNPIDTVEFAPAAPASASNDIWVCCALSEIKGGWRLLKACEILAKERPDLRVTAFGGGEYTREFLALPNVTMLARQPRWKLPRIINAHGIVLGQARLGIAGMAEFEAMACGRPVVTWFNEGAAYSDPPPFVIGLEGEELAAGLLRMAESPALRDQLGERGRDWVTRHHRLPLVVERVEAVMQAIISGEPVPAAPAA